MRCFIGIPLTNEVREKMIEIQEELKKSSTKMKLVESENLHITLRFLGEIDDFQVSEIKNKMNRISMEKFPIVFSHLGAFPNESYIRVVWVGINEGKERLIDLYKLVGGKEKKFEPHLTLARVKSKADDVLSDVLRKTLNVRMTVDNVQLIESKLTPKGPIYSKVFEVELK